MKTTVTGSALLAATLLLGACTNEDSGQPAAPASTSKATGAGAAHAVAAVDDYSARATEVAKRVHAEEDPAQIKADLLALMELASQMTPAFVATHPQCRAYLEKALEVRRRYRTLEPATIERDYHKGAALPTDGITPDCYHMKDLIVHPASALVMLSQPSPDHESAARELDEVVAHTVVVRQALQ